MAESSREFDSERLLQLVAEKCNGALTPEGHAELEAMLSSSEEACALYWEVVALHANLEWELAGKNTEGSDGTTSLLEGTAAIPRHAHAASAKRAVWYGASLAVCLLLGALIGWSLWPGDDGAPPVADREREINPPEEMQVIGRLTPIVADSHWSFGSPGNRNPESLRPGDTIWLDRGAARLQLTTNTVARLNAPVILQILSVDRVRVLDGRIRVDVPKGAEGFTVETASAEVVDLGTSFSVAVANSNTDVVVYQGEVDLKVMDPNHPRDLAENSPGRRFREGEAVRVSHDGTLSRLANIYHTTIMPTGSESHMEPLIKAVQDNIVRDDMWSFYEIVPGGLEEDAKAYVDRPHEWNGATRSGMPHYLIGGDYVKTFNNDKVTKDLRIDVTLSRPAILYLLLDKRAALPEWLTRSFEDTGDEIGFDETHFNVWEGKPIGKLAIGTGPGNSIDRTYSIWKRVVENGGVISLGANGLPARSEKPLDLNAELCMYGIVAVPLSKDK